MKTEILSSYLEDQERNGEENEKDLYHFDTLEEKKHTNLRPENTFFHQKEIPSRQNLLKKKQFHHFSKNCRK